MLFLEYFFYCTKSILFFFFFFSSRRRHTRLQGDWSSDVCSSDLLTCSSRQARTQRVHWMQESRLTAIPGCVKSALGWWRRAKRGLPTFRLRAQRSSSDSREYFCSGMSESSSSRIIFCAATVRAFFDSTSIPACGARQHEGASTRSPLTSTMQARQLPSGR